MRILMLAQFYPPDIGGEERHVRNLSIALASRGHEVQVLTSALPMTEVGDACEDGISVRRVRTTAQRLPIHGDPNRPHATPFPDLEMRRAIDRALCRGGFDVVHAHNWIVNSALAPTSRHATPLVLTLHDYGHICVVKRYVHRGSECTGPGPFKCVACATHHYGVRTGPATVLANTVWAHERRTHITHFIAVSSAVARYNRLDDGTVPFEVIPNFIPDDLVAAEPPHPLGPLVFCGDLTTQKGVLVLADAYRSLEAPPELLMAGRSIPGVTIDPTPGLRLIGPLRHDDVMPLMDSAQMVVVPSIMPDPCPTVVLEAMARSRPVIASANGGIVDMVDNGITGLLVAPGDPAALASAIARLVAEPTLAARMGVAGAERVRRFTAASVVDRIEGVYARAVAEVRARPQPS